jgi:beta-glucosidase
MSYYRNLPDYKNVNISIEDRIKDLIYKMTIKEKVRQLDQYMGTTFIDKTHPMQFTVMNKEGKILWDKIYKEIGIDGVGCIHDLYGTAEINNKLQKYCIENTRLGIPVLFSEEALHGLLRPGCTVFPHAIAQASTWNENIAFNIGRGIAAETRSFGICETFGPVLDLAREPRWGRMEENYGEDTYLASRMGAAMVKGLQGEDISAENSIIAEPKHFAVHGIPEGGLNMAHCSIGKHEMLSYYLPVFEAAFVEGGAINAMCSYNAIDGQPCSSHYELLTEILRNQWKMPGFVRSDLGAISRLYDKHKTASSKADAIKQALEGGTDMQYYDFSHELYQDSIIEMVEQGKISIETINTAVSRVLRVKFMLGLFERPYIDEKLSREVVRSYKHLEAALKSGREAICLLKNKENILPLKKDIASIAVIGPSADEARLGDYTPYIEGFNPITILEGIKDIASKDTIIKYSKGVEIIEYCKDNNETEVTLGWNFGSEGIEEAVKLAMEADVAIVALGDSEKTCGEGIDRCELGLPGRQLELLKAVHATGTPVILVLQNGRAMTLGWESENINAIIEAWYPGEAGGKAIAEVIFGDYNPAGRLPVSFPKSLGQLPVYYSRRRGGSDTYIEENNKPLFAFGHGLSYTTFSYENLKVTPENITPSENVTVTFDITNTGAVEGDEVVQLYISDLFSSMVRPEKELKRFKRIHLKPDEKFNITFVLTSKDLQLLNKDFKWVVETGVFKIIIGSSSDKEELTAEFNVI